MVVAIYIDDDGHVAAHHNPGRVLWELDVDPESLPHEFPADEQLANGERSFFEYLFRFASDKNPVTVEGIAETSWTYDAFDMATWSWD